MNLPSFLAVAALAAAGVSAPAVAAPASDATFQGLGGHSGIKQIVARLLVLVQQDARIKDSFQEIDLKNLAMRLEEQFCFLSGGPCLYKGKDMKDIHDGLNITNAQFNALAEDLQLAMDQTGVASAVQNRLIAKLAPMQKSVVTK